MNILAINCGSSSIKFKVVEASTGNFSEILGGSLEVSKNYELGIQKILRQIQVPLHGIVHRVVHGGQEFRSPTVLGPKEIKKIEKLCDLAPLHNPPAIRGIQATKFLNLPMVAVFDTEFYSSLPQKTRRYALPKLLSEKFQIFRYGFHGISHEYVLHRYQVLTRSERPTLISLHLGNGCSATAVERGKAVDTSMGFTPTEGLIMGTRPGDMDVSILLQLLSKNFSLENLEILLNRKSGLQGIAGTNDMRKILSRKDLDARLAVEMFCYRIQKYIGAYFGVLSQPKALIFTGRIGERSAFIRHQICKGLHSLGIILDPKKDKIGEGKISHQKSSLSVFVIPTDEERFMVRKAFLFFQPKQQRKKL